MTREEILQIGRKAGALIEIAQEKDLLWLERFTEMVAAKEREACAKLCESESSNVAEHMFGKECAAAIRARGNT